MTSRWIAGSILNPGITVKSLVMFKELGTHFFLEVCDSTIHNIDIALNLHSHRNDT